MDIIWPVVDMIAVYVGVIAMCIAAYLAVRRWWP